jgi:hypothetical protein
MTLRIWSLLAGLHGMAEVVMTRAHVVLKAYANSFLDQLYAPTVKPNPTEVPLWPTSLLLPSYID